MRKINQHQISTIALLSFTALILLSAVYTELFRPQKVSVQKSTQLLVNPIRKDILLDLKTIEIQNYSNSFKITKINNKWKLTNPVKMKSDLKKVREVINALKRIEVKTILKKDKLNLQNYSLNNPLLSIKLESALKEEQVINFGILNSIDDSSYLTVNNINAIYQTNIISNKLLKYTFSDFIDASIISIKLENIEKFEIINARDNRVLHIAQRVENNWISNKYNTISNKSVENKLSKILKVSAKVVVDDADEETTNFLNNYITNPKLKLNITKLSPKETDRFIVTYPTTSNKTLKIDKSQNFIIKDISNDIIYLVDKKYLSEFNIRYADFK